MRHGCGGGAARDIFEDVEESRPGFCVFIDAVCEGTIPSVGDANGRPLVFATRVLEREIADNIM
jgi:hypothetical protein